MALLVYAMTKFDAEGKVFLFPITITCRIGSKHGMYYYPNSLAQKF